MGWDRCFFCLTSMSQILLLPQFSKLTTFRSMNLFRSKFDGNARKKRSRGWTLSDNKNHEGNEPMTGAKSWANPQKGLHKDCPKGALQIMCLSQIHWFFFSLKNNNSTQPWPWIRWGSSWLWCSNGLQSRFKSPVSGSCRPRSPRYRPVTKTGGEKLS